MFQCVFKIENVFVLNWEQQVATCYMQFCSWRRMNLIM